MGSVQRVSREYGGKHMNMNDDLKNKINEFPDQLKYLANFLLKEIDSAKRSNSQIEVLLRDEIREIVNGELANENK
jgi:hypothetical protein